MARRSIIPKNAGDDDKVRVQGHDSKGKKREGAENLKEDAQPTQPNKLDQE